MIMRTALQRIEKKFGVLTAQRIVDYVVCSSHAFKDRGSNWKLNQVFGPKSMERFNSDKGRVYFENKWLESEGLSRSSLLSMIVDRSEHPKAKYIFVPSEEGTKQRLLNRSWLCSMPNIYTGMVAAINSVFRVQLCNKM